MTIASASSASAYQAIEARERATELPVYAKLPLAIVRGKGLRVWDTEGVEYLDLYGGHAVCLTGHCHPRLVEAISGQARELIFYSNAVRLPIRAEASERFCAMAGVAGGRLFYVNSGAEANDVAIKTARKVTGRTTVASFEGAFHGRTLATLSAVGIEKYKRSLGPQLLEAHHRTCAFDDLGALDAAIGDDTAAVIVEPIQSLAGIYEGAEAFYRALRRLTEERGAALIFDEVQTGFGRTGAFLYGEHWGITPDMCTFAKGIASGVPCGATLMAPSFGDRVGASDHGSTFGGGPIAMAALNATLKVIADEGLVANAKERGEQLKAELSGVAGVREVRGRGLLLGVELDRKSAPVRDALRAKGILTGSAVEAKTIRILAPLTTDAAAIHAFVVALTEILAE